MTWFDTRFTAAAWQEFARLFPDAARAYRTLPGLSAHLRPMIVDFLMAYEGR